MNVKILVFDDVELLDFAGPLEVFSVADYVNKDLGIKVSTIAFKDQVFVSKNGLKISPNETSNHERIDLLIIPGGFGTRGIIRDIPALHQIDALIKASAVIASVCTGALILAKLGYLKGLSAITHQGGIEELKQIDSSIIIDESQRFIDHGHVVTSAGISAGIDMSLYLVEKYFDNDLKMKVQKYMEYGDY